MARIREESCLETKSSSLRGHPSAIIRDSDDFLTILRVTDCFPRYLHRGRLWWHSRFRFWSRFDGDFQCRSRFLAGPIQQNWFLAGHWSLYTRHWSLFNWHWSLFTWHCDGGASNRGRNAELGVDACGDLRHFRVIGQDSQGAANRTLWSWFGHLDRHHITFTATNFSL